MVGLLVGSLISFIVVRKFIRFRRWQRYGMASGCGYHGGAGPGFGPGFGPGRGRWGRRGGGWMGFLGGLGITPEQRAELGEARGELMEVGQSLREELGSLRGDLAQALRAENFDEELLGAATVKIDSAVDTVRKTVISMVARLHQTLTPEQRAAIADRLDQAGGARVPLWL